MGQHEKTAAPRVTENAIDELPPESVTFELVIDLHMKYGNPIGSELVVREASNRALDEQLVAALRPIINHRRGHRLRIPFHSPALIATEDGASRYASLVSSTETSSPSSFPP